MSDTQFSKIWVQITLLRITPENMALCRKLCSIERFKIIALKSLSIPHPPSYNFYHQPVKLSENKRLTKIRTQHFTESYSFWVRKKSRLTINIAQGKEFISCWRLREFLKMLVIMPALRSTRFFDYSIHNGNNRTEWSPIRSVITQVISKIGRLWSGSLICQSRV